ncbi:hypothetical protein T492DRAFT_1051291 [Pavlovales sp. CCMP2436]|nr:hypothetical protein T492DRAFT_1051291 [Pavlovales sp. CCMP2436]
MTTAFSLARSRPSCNTLCNYSESLESLTESDRPFTPPAQERFRCHHCAAQLSFSAKLLDDAYCCASSRTQAVTTGKTIASGVSRKSQPSAARRLPLGRSAARHLRSFPPVNYNSHLEPPLARSFPPVNYNSHLVLDLVRPPSLASTHAPATTTDVTAFRTAFNLARLAAELHISTPNKAELAESPLVGLSTCQASWCLVGLVA